MGILIDGADPSTYQITMAELKEEGMRFLALCGKMTMKLKAEDGEKVPGVSPNECLGMACHVLAERANAIELLAELEEVSNG